MRSVINHSIPKTNRFRITFLVCLLIAAGLIACFPVMARALDARAVVDQTRIGREDTVRLNVIVNGEADVDASVIKDFNIISRGTSSSVRIVNTQYSKETTYQFVLLPLSEGELRIPPLKVSSGKESVYTQPIGIQVSAIRPKDTGQRDIFVQASVSAPQAVEGEQIVYTVRLYRTVDIDNARLQKPDFEGFTAAEIEGNRSGQTILSGRQYAFTEISYVLMPLQSGQLTIEPAILSCDMIRRSRRRRFVSPDSFFDDPFFNRGRLEKKVLQTEALTVTVKPLPGNSGDVKFSGLVGQANFSAEIEVKEITVGDSATLTLKIEGSGNIMDAEAPVVAVPDGFKVYRDNPQEEVTLKQDGYSGRKTFRLALVPVREGTFSIPPVRFNYFDTTAGQYKTIASPSFSIRVNPSHEPTMPEAVSANIAGEQSSASKRSVKFTGRDILPIKEDLGALNDRQALSFGRFAMLALLPPLLYLLLAGFLRFARKAENPARALSKKAAQLLKEATAADISDEAFHSLLYKALITGIRAANGASGKFAEGASLTRAEAETMLRKGEWKDSDIQAVLELFQRIEAARYGGSSLDADSRETLLADTRRMLGRLS